MRERGYRNASAPYERETRNGELVVTLTITRGPLHRVNGVAAVGNRYDSYSYALDHLLVETPHREAIGVNGALSDLAVWVEAAQRGDFCSGAGVRPGKGVGVALPSRVLLQDRSGKGS